MRPLWGSIKLLHREGGSCNLPTLYVIVDKLLNNLVNYRYLLLNLQYKGRPNLRVHTTEAVASVTSSVDIQRLHGHHLLQLIPLMKIEHLLSTYRQTSHLRHFLAVIYRDNLLALHNRVQREIEGETLKGCKTMRF